MPLSLTPVDATPSTIITTPALTAIKSHTSVATIPAHFITGTNNGSDRNSLDGLQDIVEMGSPPAATIALSSFCVKINNVLLRAQVSLQEEVPVALITNTVSAIPEL